ncbi:hypothetical protein PTKIN_Ptkin01aG0103200 [Pterospermum kingtungense]
MEFTSTLLVRASKKLQPVTDEEIYQIYKDFSTYGAMIHIIICDGFVGFQAIIQYPDNYHAIFAKINLQGRKIWDDGHLDIQYSSYHRIPIPHAIFAKINLQGHKIWDDGHLDIQYSSYHRIPIPYKDDETENKYEIEEIVVETGEGEAKIENFGEEVQFEIERDDKVIDSFEDFKDDEEQSNKNNKVEGEIIVEKENVDMKIEEGIDEVGQSPSIWDVLSHTQGKIIDEKNAEATVNFYHRDKEDIDLIAKLGFKAYRFSISWPHIFQDGLGTKVNDKGITFYKKLIDTLYEKGIEFYVIFHHRDLQLHLHEPMNFSLDGFYTHCILESILKACLSDLGIYFQSSQEEVKSLYSNLHLEDKVVFQGEWNDMTLKDLEI